MKVLLPDGKPLELEEGASGADAAAAIGPGLARDAVAVRVGGEVVDLSARLVDSSEIEILTITSDGALEVVRHDAAHVLAAAVVDLWPKTKVSIGPAIEDGFYYDFEFPESVTISDADFEQIEAKMAEHVAAAQVFERDEVALSEALERFRSEGQDYKVELIEDIARDQGVQTVSLYRNGPFVDLCRGPHGPSTEKIAAFKLMSVAGAYWRGDEKNKMLTRIYGTAFFSKKDLQRHLERIEAAKARDHRRLGPELGLFVMRPEAPGMPFFLPNGMKLIAEIEKQVRAQLDRRGYSEIRTPQILDEELWHRSGHYENYREHMYFTSAEDRHFAVKPMNCPGACLVYESERRSYRDLPLRLAEFGLCSRREREGVLHGLLRVRAFVQDDAHVFCTQEQITDEVVDICASISELYDLFGFESVKVELSTRPDKSIGSDADWKLAEQSLTKALDQSGQPYSVNPGDGAFYGPKIDFHVTDAIGRSWQCGTCQLDFFMPERFGLKYVGADDERHRPVLIHRALLGSIERFLGILIEHYGGDFPVWLAPTQALVLPISERHIDYAQQVLSELSGAGVRAELDLRSETIGRRIREAELRKIPYMLVLGDSEIEARTISVREHGKGDAGSTTLSELIQRFS